MNICILRRIETYSTSYINTCILLIKKGYHQNNLKNHDKSYFMEIAIFTNIIISL